MSPFYYPISSSINHNHVLTISRYLDQTSVRANKTGMWNQPGFSEPWSEEQSSSDEGDLTPQPASWSEEDHFFYGDSKHLLNCGDYPPRYDEREYTTPPPQVATQNEESSTEDTINIEPQSEPEDN